MSKTVHLHIGPHKTGSTAIQHQMRKHQDILLESHGLTYITLPAIKAVSKALLAEDMEDAEAALGDVLEAVAAAPGDCVISCEDWAGDLPGRSLRRRVYPRLWANIKLLRRVFEPHATRFYVFLREPEAWIRSAYVQHLRFRPRFHTQEDFEKWLHHDGLWDGVLARPRARLGRDLVEIAYDGGPEFSSVDALVLAMTGAPSTLPPMDSRRNTSPAPEMIRLLEVINGSGASNEAKRIAKQHLQSEEASNPTPADGMSFPNWPPNPTRPTWLGKGLQALWGRAEARVNIQAQTNLLPDPYADLRPMRARLIEASEEFPDGGRARMENQIDILSYRFRGKPEICRLNALIISYLRRGTPHTEHAAYLFQRVWSEEYPILLGVLPTRWLISVFQTFMDHGANEAQRQIGAAAYFMTNTIKLYESERAIEGLKPGATYPGVKPQTRSGFRGLDRFPVGGTDLMLNMNALMLEMAGRDAAVGRVVQEFYLRMKVAQTAFSRMDQNRVHHGVENPQFSNCWSFFEPPEG